MSLHAQLSPEAQARLAAQKRTSTLTSLVIALLLMVLVGVILMIIAMASNVKIKTQMVSYNGAAESEDNLKQKKVQTQIERKPAAPSSSMSKVIAANTTSPTAIPVPEIDVPDPSTDFGDGNDFGDGWGDGDGSGSGGGFGNIPTAMKKRCSKADRLQRLADGGGTPACEDAVVKSLRWLKKTQAKDGSWTGRKTSMTGLALLAFLGHCETAGSEEFGETVLAATTFLVDKAMKNNGKLADDFKDKHWCYEHSIAVYALAEAYTLCVKSFGENIPNLEQAVMDSGQFLINSQHKSGGWEYGYSEDSARGGDTSIVGWHMQALKACKFTGLDFANLKKCYKKGVDYLERMQAANGGLGYSNPGSVTPTRASIGALCFQIWEGSSDRRARKAIKYMHKELAHGTDNADFDLYGHYYAAQAMINHGGKEWENYNTKFRDDLLGKQVADGSFKGLKMKHGNSDHYSTCLATLMLEVYYRFLPGTGQKN
jgi:hypothetical protein